MQTRSLVFTAVLAASMLAASEAVASIDVNGGLSWNGWTSRGTSTTLGVYGKGSTANVYEIYTTYFNYGGETITGSPAGSLSLAPGGTGAFAAGNRILGVGIRRISGAAISGSGGAPIVRFDVGNNSYFAASTVGGSDGRTNSTSDAHAHDFNCQFSTAAIAPSNLVVFSGADAGAQRPNLKFSVLCPLRSGVLARMFPDRVGLHPDSTRVGDTDDKSWHRLAHREVIPPSQGGTSRTR